MRSASGTCVPGRRRGPLPSQRSGRSAKRRADRARHPEPVAEQLRDLAHRHHVLPVAAGGARQPAHALRRTDQPRRRRVAQPADDAAHRLLRPAEDHRDEVRQQHALVEELGADLGVGRAAEVEEHRAVVGVPSGLGVHAEPLRQSGGHQGGVQPVLDREAHAEVGRQAQGRHDLRRPHGIGPSRRLPGHLANVRRRRTYGDAVRFAIKTMPEHTTWRAMLDVWQAADDIELFESAWNWDHFYPLTGDHTGPNFEGWTMVAAMAQATRRIRVGCQVTGMIYRHPAVLANMAATVDHIANGRLELGLGAAWNEEETAAYGIPLPPLKERFDRFDEGVETIVALLTQETTTFDGRYVQLADARCEPKPVQRPHPPITIGGNGPTAHPACRRALGPAVELAHQLPRGVAAPPRGAAAALCGGGPRPGEILCSVNARVAKDGSAQDWAGRVADLAAGYAEAGAGLLVVNVPRPHDPRDLEPLAQALRPLGAGQS